MGVFRTKTVILTAVVPTAFRHRFALLKENRAMQVWHLIDGTPHVGVKIQPRWRSRDREAC